MLGIIGAVAVLAGCMSAPMSSVNGRARPTHTIENGDGTTTFEFVFPYDGNWNLDMAKQRIKEYLTTYARLNGFSGYVTINAAAQLISEVNRASAAVDILADMASAASGDTSAPAQDKKDRFVRVIEHVKFKT